MAYVFYWGLDQNCSNRVLAEAVHCSAPDKASGRACGIIYLGSTHIRMCSYKLGSARRRIDTCEHNGIVLNTKMFR